MPPASLAATILTDSPLAQFESLKTISHKREGTNSEWWLLPVCLGQLIQLCTLSLFVLSSQYASPPATVLCLPLLGTLSLFLLSLPFVCLPVLLQPPLRPVLIGLNFCWLLLFCFSIVAWLIHSFVSFDSVTLHNCTFFSAFLLINLTIATLWLNRLFLIFRSLPSKTKTIVSVAPLNAFER